MPLRPLSACLLLLAVQLVVSSLVMKRDRTWRVSNRECRHENDYCMFAYKRSGAIYTAPGLCTCDTSRECQLKKRTDKRWYFTCQVPIPYPEEYYEDDQEEEQQSNDSESALQLLRLQN
uniref:Uncharacterized protein n=1 Tax=Plectus sambesii TaxID=2011161 RepID=A0A914VLF6_9BILA